MKKLLYLIALYLLFSNTYLLAQCDLNQEYIALRALYLSTDGDNWTDKTGWLTEAEFDTNPTMPAGTDVDTWYGVTTDGEGCVTCIDLDGIDGCSSLGIIGNNLVGILPSELGSLDNLQWLYLDNNQLTSIPPEIGNLDNLQTLELRGNELMSIPPEIGNLDNLEWLQLYANQLTSIPPEIGNLNNLQVLFLDFNQLTSIPPEIGNLNNLQALFLNVNQLTSIPPEIGNLDNLQSLSLDVNELTIIPPEIGNLDNLQWLSLPYNQLMSIPPEIGNLDNLQSLYLHDNELTSIPPEIGNLDNLQVLWLNSNSLTFEDIISSFDEINTTIQQNATESWHTYIYAPQDSIGTDTTLTLTTGDSYTIDLIVDDTVTTSTYQWYKDDIPYTTTTTNKLPFNNIQPSDVGTYTCEVTNPIAPDLTLYSRPVTLVVEEAVSDCQAQDYLALRALYLSTDGDNWTDTTGWFSRDEFIANDTMPAGTDVGTWYGVTTDMNGCVTCIDMDGEDGCGSTSDNGNNLVGMIPPELGDLSELIHLRLDSNSLSGNIPLQLGGLENLESLILSNNQLTGSIPFELGNLTNLTRLHFRHNELTGSIPPELGGLENLESLVLSNNQLTGSIPFQLGDLVNLKSLALSNNQLTGIIPPELGNLVNLELLHLGSDTLGGNMLSGSIPHELGNLTNLTWLHFRYNELTGSIPPELGNLVNLVNLWLSSNQLSGSIPPELGNLENLRQLHLFGNQLTCNIPPELGKLTNLIQFLLSDNNLCGTVPPELANLDNLTHFAIHTSNTYDCYAPALQDLCNVGTIYANSEWHVFCDFLNPPECPSITPLTLTATNTPPSCNNNDGSITLQVSGGMCDYKYAWSNGLDSIHNQNGLAEGTYFVTITDCLDSMIIDSVELQQTNIEFDNIIPIDANCHGDNTGAIHIETTGDAPPFTFVIEGNNSIQETATVSSNTHTFTGLSAGMYNVTVTDNLGCTNDTSGIMVSESPPLVVVIDSTSETLCIGESTNLSVSGASTYEWTPATGLNATDIPNPIATPTTTTTYIVNGYTLTNLIFNGDFEQGDIGFTSEYIPESPPNDGWFAQGHYIVGNDPSLALTYWPSCSDNTTTGMGNMMIVDGHTIPNQSIWCQTVSVTPDTDYDFSAWAATIEAGNPAILELSINDESQGIPLTLTNTTCNWQEFSASWNSGANTTAHICLFNQEINSAGNDFALDDITFTTSCSVTESITIYVSELTATTTQVNVSCFGGNDGLIDLTVANGVEPYTFDWDNDGTGDNDPEDLTNLSAGTYSVIITDANGCTQTSSATITQDVQPPPPTIECYESTTFNTTTCVWDITGTQPTEPSTACYETANFNDLTCEWDITGEQDPMPTDLECYETATFNEVTCVWDITGEQDPMPTNLECWETTTFNTTTCVWDITGTQPPQPTTECYETTTFNDVTCIWDVTGVQDFELTSTSTDASCENADGTATVTASGGTPPYTYQWDDINTQTDSMATDLPAGSYNVTVTDVNNCIAIENITIDDSDMPITTPTSTDATCGASDGTAEVTPTSGTMPYTYLWSDGQTTALAIGLSAGTYTITITDANQCTAIIDAEVAEAATLPQICDDGNPCTIDDIRIVLAADSSVVCEPCMGILDTSSCHPDCVSTEPCDDGEICTVDDTATIAADGTTCQCTGVFVSEEEQPIDVPPGITPYVPDGKNDKLVIADFNSNEFIVRRMTIYNRAGQVVYDKKIEGMSPFWSEGDWWDGTCNIGSYNGELLPKATYYYTIEYGTECLTGGYSQKGSVFIL